MKLALSTRIKRLTTLAVMLESIADSTRRTVGFHLSRWKTTKSSLTLEQSDRPECGTAKCAGGFVATHPGFRKLGVRAGCAGAPIYKGEYGFDALRELFGISDLESQRFFSSSTYSEVERNDPLAVAIRVRSKLESLKDKARREARRA